MHTNATEQITKAYEGIRKLILDKALLPGQKMTQEKLAAQLGVSRTPLRSALRMLEGENLVVAVPRRGMFVREFTTKEVIEVYECRAALEGLACELLASRATPEDIQELSTFFEPFKNGKPIDADAYRIADRQFHEAIIAKCGNEYLNRMIQQGSLLLSIDMIGVVWPPEDTIDEHLSIIEALRVGDGQLAKTLLRLHLQKSQEILTEG